MSDLVVLVTLTDEGLTELDLAVAAARQHRPDWTREEEMATAIEMRIAALRVRRLFAQLGMRGGSLDDTPAWFRESWMSSVQREDQLAEADALALMWARIADLAWKVVQERGGQHSPALEALLREAQPHAYSVDPQQCCCQVCAIIRRWQAPERDAHG